MAIWNNRALHRKRLGFPSHLSTVGGEPTIRDGVSADRPILPMSMVDVGRVSPRLFEHTVRHGSRPVRAANACL